MASSDSKELLTTQPENTENEVHDNVSLTRGERKGEGFLTVVEDDKTNERVENEDIQIDNKAEVKGNSALASAVSGSTVVGHGKANDGGEKDAENDKKADALNSSSKEAKKNLRKRKKNAEEVPAQAVSSPSKILKKKLNDTNAVKIIKEVSCDNSIEGNAKEELKSDEKLESEAIPEAEEKEKSGTKQEVKKTVKKKIVPSKSTNVEIVAATSSIPVVKKDTDGSKDNSSIGAGNLNNADKPSPSASKKPLKKADDAEKQSKRVDGMGLVFICNAKTKKDCFRYNVLGLPKSKKDLVTEIYKGMRLFLFDVDLKLMYGIYKAAGPGGYNIEPKAFDSKFPSQVRFTVLKDCLPLPEEKFKAAIKENYYKGNHFDSKLTAEQVRNLCKLFQSATGNASKHNTQRAGTVREASTREANRRLVRRYAREAYQSPPRARYQSPPRVRYLSPLPRARYLSPPPRARYLSPPPRGLPMQMRALPPSYAYEPLADDYYTRDRLRALEPVDYRDPYATALAYPSALPPAYAARLHQPRSPPRYLY